MTNYFINYEHVTSLGIDCNKQLFTVVRNTKWFFKWGFFLTYQKRKKITNNILMKPTPGALVKPT